MGDRRRPSSEPKLNRHNNFILPGPSIQASGVTGGAGPTKVAVDLQDHAIFLIYTKSRQMEQAELGGEGVKTICQPGDTRPIGLDNGQVRASIRSTASQAVSHSCTPN